MLEEGGDVESTHIDLGEDVLPEQIKKAKKGKEPPKGQKEPQEDPENKRMTSRQKFSA